uniref:Bcr/CflA family multidrug efflux MFS transporter n=1 Tax=Thaumasiovibrio occultus TaxID=1891184 RepID=UPI000B34B13D|nr:Bcr/CflA family multidrug efflux MFS transporter [Thaumasiovibrio occultus]
MKTSNNLPLIVLLGAIAALTPLAIDMYLPAMPTIGKDLGASESAVQITLALYTAGFALGQLFFGPLADAFGRKPVLLFGIAAFAVTSLLCATSVDIAQLKSFRLAQGLSGAAAAVIIQALVRDMFERSEFARIMAFITLVMTVAPLVAPVLGGYVSVHLGWKAIFYGLSVFATLTLAAVYWRIPETLQAENRQPLRIGVTLRNYLKLLSNPSALGYVLCSAFSFCCMMTFLTTGPYVYIQYFGIREEHFGFYFALNIVCLSLFTVFNGKMVRKLGSATMLNIALCIQVVSGLAMVAAYFLNLGLWGTVVPVMMTVGVMSIIGSNTMACLLNNYPNMAGTASAIAGTMRFGVGACVSAIVALIPGTSSLPMALTIAVCACLSAFFYMGVARRAEMRASNE